MHIDSTLEPDDLPHKELIITQQVFRNFCYLFDLLYSRIAIVYEQKLLQNSTDIVHQLRTVADYWDISKYLFSPFASNATYESIGRYTHVFITYPEVPHDVLMFSPDYEQAVSKKKLKTPDLNSDGIHYLVHRIQTGKIYPENTFNFWCGCTTKQVIFPPFQFNVSTSRTLTKIIKKSSC